MSVDIWLQILKNNIEIHLPYDSVLNEKVLQEAVSKDPILNLFADMSRNDVGLYQHY